MGLQRLSIAENPRLPQDTTETPRKNGGINLSLNLQRSTNTNNPKDKADDCEHEQLLYALASKKRRISELQQELKIASRDLRGLEEQWKFHAARRQPTTTTTTTTGPAQHWHGKVQKSGESGGLLQSIVSKLSELTWPDDDDEDEDKEREVVIQERGDGWQFDSL